MMSSTDRSTYNADYYKTSNYADYMERADRYKKTAYELSNLLKQLSLATNDSCLLDYGCAVGFLMEGFKEVGHKNVIGFEVSEWAANEALERGNTVTTELGKLSKKHVDVMVSLDVFEHMTDEQVFDAIDNVNPRALVVRIPVSTDGGKTFHLAVSRADKTHINCKTSDQWIEFFTSIGFKTFLRLNLFTVYDTPGVLCLLIL